MRFVLYYGHSYKNMKPVGNGRPRGPESAPASPVVRPPAPERRTVPPSPDAPKPATLRLQAKPPASHTEQRQRPGENLPHSRSGEVRSAVRAAGSQLKDGASLVVAFGKEAV